MTVEATGRLKLRRSAAMVAMAGDEVEWSSSSRWWQLMGVGMTRQRASVQKWLRVAVALYM